MSTGTPLQSQAGAVGQTRGVEIFLRLGQIDADAHHDAVAVGADLAQDADDFFFLPFSKRSFGHSDLAVDAVALAQGVADGQTGKQRQRGGLDQIGPDDGGVVQALVGASSQLRPRRPARRSVGGVDRADGTGTCPDYALAQRLVLSTSGR